VPNKTDALKYLDSDSAQPSRYARVIINRGAAEQAGIDDYLVGPLPASQDTTITPLSWPYNSGRNSVKNPLPNYEDILAWFSALGKEVADMVEDLLGEVVNPGHLENAPPLMALSRPAAFENGTVSAWARIHSPGLRFDAWSLLAQGMFCRFEITGRDSEKWNIHEWYYDGVLYNSTQSFRTAWTAGDVRKLPANRDGSWTAAEPNAKGVPGRDQVAPVMIQPGGPRYKLDEKERHVSWLGWSFYINSLQAIGLGLWDVKFDGERILYELGLQEAMAHYAGNDPLAVGMYWLDTLFGMGFNSYELVPGYDCPAYATYMPMTFHQGEETIVRNNSLCVFEWTASDPIQVSVTRFHNQRLETDDIFRDIHLPPMLQSAVTIISSFVKLPRSAITTIQSRISSTSTALWKSKSKHQAIFSAHTTTSRLCEKTSKGNVLSMHNMTTGTRSMIS
jgi:primary-amine oxidase